MELKYMPELVHFHGNNFNFPVLLINSIEIYFMDLGSDFSLNWNCSTPTPTIS